MKPFTPYVLASLLITSAVALIVAPAHAQVTPSVDPGQLGKRLEDSRTLEPQATPSPIIQAPSVEDAVAPGMDGVTFPLYDVQIHGSTVYSAEELKAEFSGLIGQTVSLADVQRTVNNITRRYRNDGYVLSKAVLPAQQVGNGVVQVRVVEGFVSKVVLEGDVGDRNLIEKYMKKIEGMQPLRINELERYILLTNDLPGVSAKAVLRPSAGVVGGADVVVTVSQDKFEGSVGVDNRGSKFIGRHQFTTTLAANNLLGMYDRTTVRNITTAQTNELRFFDIQHEEQVNSEGTKLRVTVARADSEPGSTLEPLDIEGDSTSFAVGAYHPVIRSRAQNLTLRSVFDYRNTRTEILDAEFSDDRIRSLRIGGAFDVADRFDGINLIDAELAHGLDVLSASDQGFNRSRADADSDFTKVEVNLARRQQLPWQLSLLASASGQYAFDPLFSAEEYRLGGVGFGQAYDPSEITGDHGIGTHLELQYGDALGQPYMESYQVYTYYDIGAVWQERSRFVSSADRQSLASAGLGLRFNINEAISGSTELAVPLTRELGANGENDPRVFFSLIGRF